jgi:hypothetical protein
VANEPSIGAVPAGSPSVTNLNPRHSADSRRVQELLLDGIEFSIRMAEYAYERLRAHAARYRLERGEGMPTQELLFLDAWSVVDSAKRLRASVDQLPNLKKTPAIKSFLNKSSGVVAFRNYHQHLESQAVSVARTGWPIWGALAWLELLEPASEGKGRLVSTQSISAGRFGSHTAPLVNPLGKMILAPTDHFLLTVADGSVNLSELLETIRIFSIRFDQALRKAVERRTVAGNDTHSLLIEVEVL